MLYAVYINRQGSLSLILPQLLTMLLEAFAMSRARVTRIIAGLLSLACTLMLCMPVARALPSGSDVTLSAKYGSYQTGEQFSFSAAFSYTGAPNTPGSIEYRPVTWTITNMNIGTCQYAASAQGIELTNSGNYTLLIAYNAYAYDSETGLYSILVGDETVSVHFTVTDSVIPNTIDVAEIDISLLIILIGVVGAIICIAFLKRRVYAK